MVDDPVVAMSPRMVVPIPWLVIPAVPPMTAKLEARPKLGWAGLTLAAVFGGVDVLGLAQPTIIDPSKMTPILPQIFL
jgi:hypothetical protein